MRHYLPVLFLPLLAACSAMQPAATQELAASKGSHLTGTVAPAFTLLDTDRKNVSLSDFKGQWVVVYFYGYDDIPGCPCHAGEYTDLLVDMAKLPVPVLAISDSAPEDAYYYSTRYGIDLDKVKLLTDDNKVMVNYGSRPDAAGMITRGTFLIDPAGKIAYHWPVVVASGHIERIKAVIKALRKDGGAAATMPATTRSALE